MTKRIELTQGYTATVDDKDFEWLNQYEWRVLKPSKSEMLYAITTVYSESIRTTMFMHRALVGVTDPRIQIDHRDTNGLNNTRDNLRMATHGNNMHNRPAPKTNTSGYKGVIWQKAKKKWRARIMINGKNIHLGYFDDKDLAARAYNEAALEHHGEFARLNYR